MEREGRMEREDGEGGWRGRVERKGRKERSEEGRSVLEEGGRGRRINLRYQCCEKDKEGDPYRQNFAPIPETS
jgi:hypothetical protein